MLTPTTSTIQSLDLSVTQEYITALTGSSDTLVTFQTFAEPKGDAAHNKALTDVWTDSVSGSQQRLSQLNKAGAGIYVTVQQTDGTGRKAENITAIRSLFVDFDGHLPTGSEWHLQPSIIVRNPDNKGHAYWVLLEPSEPDGESFKQQQQRLISHYQEFGADKAIHDLARVLRLPGSYHLKNEPTLAALDYCGSERYTVDQVMTGVAELAKKVKGNAPNKSQLAIEIAHSIPFSENKDFDSKLKASAAKLASCTENRNCTLNTEAYTLAGLSGNDSDKLEAIRVTLTAAALQSGLEQAEIDTTLNSAIPAGVLKPIASHGSDQPQKLPSLYAADLLVSDVLTNIKFDTHASQWFEYDGKGKWNPVMDTRIQKLAKDYLRGVLPPFSLHYLNECIALARTDVQVDGWSEMSSLLYLPFTNGVLDIKANQFLPHSPDYHFTWQLPRAYAPQLGEWLQIDRFLDTLANNDSGLKQLATAFCNAVLKGRSDLQKFLYLFGEGGNGKGAFMNLLKMLIGSENIHSTTMGELNGNRFESANLKGKRLLVMSDEDKRSGGVGVFKSATGGDSLRFEQKGKDASHFIYTGMVVVAANSPTFAGVSDGGIKRRKVDFPCKSFIQEMDRVDMAPLFDADLTAFTSYLLSLDDAWVTETIRKASNLEAVKELGRELAIREDSVAAFADAMEITVNPVGRVLGVYVAYKRFCELSGLKPKSVVNFIPNFIECCKAEGFEVSNKRDNKGKYLLGLTMVVPEMYI